MALSEAVCEYKIGNYNLADFLGSGKFGAVYKAEDQYDSSLVFAVKILNPDNNPDFKNRFNKEAAALFKLDHTNIVRYYDRGVENNNAFIRMEYAEGQSLEKVMQKSKKPSQTASVTIMSQVLDALTYAHSKGIIHSDLHAGNIIVDKDNSVKITDFGLAKLVGDEQFSKYSFSKSRFSARKSLTEKDDIYAAGLLLYDLLKEKDGSVKDAYLESIIKKATSVVPKESYQHIEEMRDDLIKFDSAEKTEPEYDKFLYSKTTGLLESHPELPLDCKELKTILSNKSKLKNVPCDLAQSLDELMKQRCSKDYLVMAESRQGVADTVLKKEYKLNDTQITKLIKNLETHASLMDFQKANNLLDSKAVLRFSFDKSYLEQDIESLHEILDKRNNNRAEETKSFLKNIFNDFSNLAKEYWKIPLFASLAVGDYCMMQHYSGTLLSPLFNSMEVAGAVVGAITYVGSESSGTASDFFKNAGVGAVIGAGIAGLTAMAANACGAAYIPGMNFKELQMIEGGIFGSVAAFVGGLPAKEILKQYDLI